MKTRLPSLLLAALLVVFPPAAPAGTVMYVGDSITHGMNSGTYRWASIKYLRTTAFPTMRKA